MSAREVAYRAAQALTRERRRLQARRVGPLPPAARRLTAGTPRGIRFFDITLEYPGTEPIAWCRDYRSGVTAPLLFYGDLDYRDERQVGDSKVTWELNRHQFLVAWALEYAEAGDESAAASVGALILDWIAANPRFMGINWVSSLELALRILSWGIALDLCRASPAIVAARTEIAASVAEQARFIRETQSLHSSANNHLMGELVGLLAAAAFFPEAKAVREHADFARERVCVEALRQNCADGVNREQAVYYHHYTAEYVLTAMSLFERMGWAVPQAVTSLARRMLEFVDVMTDERGQPFEVGDRDDGSVTGLNLATGVGVYESLLWTGWQLYADASQGAHAARIARARGAQPAPDRRTRYWLGPSPSGAALPSDDARVTRRFFPEGGYFVSSDDDFTVMLKSGPFGYPSIAAHAHCDQLSLGLRWRGGATVLTDSGTYAYHTEDRWRRYFRGTAAHNTIRVDGADQAEYAGPFLWASHADGRLELRADTRERFEVRGVHDGYRRLDDPVAHERILTWRRGRGYRVLDRVGGRAGHSYELFWNFGDGVSVEPRTEARPGATRRAAWQLRLEGQPVLVLLVASDVEFRAEARFGDDALPAGWESRSYLAKRPIHQLALAATAQQWEVRTFLLTLARETDPEVLRAATEGWD
jgi:hypothetical protein